MEVFNDHHWQWVFNIFIKNLGTKNNILLTQFTDNENLEDKNSTERNQNYVDT